MELLRIVQIIPSLRKGGAERLVLDICRELDLRPYIHVKLILFHDVNDYGFLSKELDLQCFPSSVTLAILKRNQFNVASLESFLKEFDPHVVHSHLFEAEIISRSLGLGNVKHFTHFHDNMKQLRRFSLQTLFKKELITNFYERSYLLDRYRKVDNHFIAISKHTLAYIKENMPEWAGTSHLLFNSIDTKRFQCDPKAERDKLKLVTIGSLVEKKGQSFCR